MMRFYCTQNTRHYCAPRFRTRDERVGKMGRLPKCERRDCVCTQVAHIHRFRLIEYLTLIFLLCVEKLKFYSFKHLHSIVCVFFLHLHNAWKIQSMSLLRLTPFFCRLSRCSAYVTFFHVKIPVMRFKICISAGFFDPWICLLQHIRQLMYWIVQANSCWPPLHTFGDASFYCPLYTREIQREWVKLRLNWPIFFSFAEWFNRFDAGASYTLSLEFDRSTGKLLQIKFIVAFLCHLQFLLLYSLARLVRASLSNHTFFFGFAISHATGFKIFSIWIEMCKQKQKLYDQLRIERERKKNCESHKNTTIELKFMPKRI